MYHDEAKVPNPEVLAEGNGRYTVLTGLRLLYSGFDFFS